MVRNPRIYGMLVAAVLAALLIMPFLPGAQSAKTEPRSENSPPAVAAPPPEDAEEPPQPAEKENGRTPYEKLAIKKLEIERPEEPEPEAEEPAEEPAPEPREARVEDADAERGSGAGVLPGQSSGSDAAERRAAGRRAAQQRVAQQQAAERRAEEQRVAQLRSRLAGVENAKPVPKPKEKDERLWLTVPRTGLKELPVGDSPRQAYLDREGVMHLSGTGFPSERGSNTYIAGHAAGYDEARYPNIFRDLPNVRKGDVITVRDGTMRTYQYRVYERVVVTPYDVWVTKSVAGKQIVSLQTCYPAPTYHKRLIVRAELIK